MSEDVTKLLDAIAGVEESDEADVEVERILHDAGRSFDWLEGLLRREVRSLRGTVDTFKELEEA